MSNQTKNKATTLVLKFEDGSTQQITPSEKFEGNWNQLAEAIALGRKYTMTIN